MSISSQDEVRSSFYSLTNSTPTELAMTWLECLVRLNCLTKRKFYWRTFPFSRLTTCKDLALIFKDDNDDNDIRIRKVQSKLVIRIICRVVHLKYVHIFCNVVAFSTFMFSLHLPFGLNFEIFTMLFDLLNFCKKKSFVWENVLL